MMFLKDITLRIDSMNTVYIKTQNAIKELADLNKGLSIKHRQVLIMVDGKRSNIEIARAFNSATVVQVLADLEQLGFLENRLNKSFKADAYTTIPVNHIQQAEVIAQELSADHLLFIKGFLLEQTRAHLGLLGLEIEQKIMLIKNNDDLRHSIARWHLSVRDSKNGRMIADKLMEELLHIMATSPQSTISKIAS
jgi:hypothetical protein